MKNLLTIRDYIRFATSRFNENALFYGHGMGTKNALETLLARARELNLAVAFTDPFYDIDEERDLTRLAAELRIAPLRAPRTAAWLKQWGEAVAQLPTATDDP